MKSTTHKIASWIALIGIPLTAGILFAQTTSLSIEPEAEISALPEMELMAPEAIPTAGTFFLLSDLVQHEGAPPYPCLPQKAIGAAVYSVVGLFLVDDSALNPSAFAGLNPDLMMLAIQEQLEPIISRRLARMERQSAFAMTTMDGPTPPGEWEPEDTNEWPGIQFVSPVYNSNDLWLEMTSKTNNTRNFIIHPPSNEEGTCVYDLFMTTNLTTYGAGLNGTNWIWLVRTAPGQTNLNYTHSTEDLALYRLGRTNDTDGDGLTDAMENLWSHSDPNNADQNGNGIPDGWEWQYFGDFNQATNADFDLDGKK